MERNEGEIYMRRGSDYITVAYAVVIWLIVAVEVFVWVNNCNVLKVLGR